MLLVEYASLSLYKPYKQRIISKDKKKRTEITRADVYKDLKISACSMAEL